LEIHVELSKLQNLSNLENLNTPIDVTFIGSGISTSFSLLNLLNLIEKNEDTKKIININVIEKYSEFNTGIPYGSRSGFSTLLITSLKNFLIEPERQYFITWLNTNKHWLLEEFKNEGGKLSKNWLKKHKTEIDNNDWENLFIPRRFFGSYIDLKLKNKIKHLEGKKLIQTTFISDKVIDLEKHKGQYAISTSENGIINSKKVVLSVGSLPTRQLWKNKSLIKKEHLMFINKPYKPELSSVLSKIKSFASKRKGKKTNVLIIGANASALELLYKINDLELLGGSKKHKFAFLSTQGRVPDAEIDFIRQKEFKPVHLALLKNESDLTAKIIADAVYKDLDLSDEIELGAASTVDKISKSFGSLFYKLGTKELEQFACYYGNDIGKRQRCAGIHYSNVVKSLKAENRFKHIAGRFTDLVLNEDNTYSLQYLDTETAQKTICEDNFHIIINCVGSNNLDSDKIPSLIKNLIKKDYCKPNDSKIGFHVNKNLEATEGLYIMGPLLAGNVIDGKPVWHVEHCGRIIWLSEVLSKILIKDVTSQKAKEDDDSYTFEVRSLNKESDIAYYKDILKRNWNNNIYYVFEHLKYFKNKTDSLNYFVLKKNNLDLILMPIILRQIKNKNGDTSTYYDAITPYGYSGPLLNDYVTYNDIKVLWNHIDSWYFENNVVTEFIRFSLNKNYLGYSGLLVSSLVNVKGELCSNFEKQWASFLPKVRNNYRKAKSYELEIKILHAHEITESVISLFFDIYTQTMKRHNAKEIYFFSLKYFKDLIFNNLTEFAIVFTYLENKAISTELVIISNDTLHAFLGGTDANFYHCRPNDFLRVEFIKWAIDKKFKYYLLGGGLSDNDGLYKHKKSLFPKDEDVMFYTGRKIINHEIYEFLCSTFSDENYKIQIEELEKNFFPLYRDKR